MQTYTVDGGNPTQVNTEDVKLPIYPNKIGPSVQYAPLLDTM